MASELPLSKLAVVAVTVGLAAGALGYSGYQKASLANEDLRRLRASLGDTADQTPIETLEGEVTRLTARVADLERQLRAVQRSAGGPAALAAAPLPAPGPAGAAPADPSPAPSGSGSGLPRSLTTVPKDPAQREERKRMVSEVVTSHWKSWGAQHGLTPQQSDQLASVEADASRRKLDNQAKMVDGALTQPEVRAENQTVTEDVRRKAKAMLTDEQFAQFEAEKGAEWGSSYRRVRQADTRSPAAP